MNIPGHKILSMYLSISLNCLSRTRIVCESDILFEKVSIKQFYLIMLLWLQVTGDFAKEG